MSDLISRQAAITIPVTPKEDREYQTFNLDDAYEQAWDDLQKRIEQLPSAEQWIPVTERLPKPIAPSQRREWFITSNQYGGVTLTCYEFEASPFKEGWQTDMTILAWMPLPEPWRGDEDERTD